MKKLVLIAAIALACTVATSRISAQSAMFTYTGVPAGPVTPGSSFTIGMSLVFTSGGIIPDLQGVSFWMAQRSPASGFPFSLTGRDGSGSLFINSGPPPPPLALPQALDPINRYLGPLPPNQVSTDLGGLALAPLPSGTYFIANLTFAVAANALPGNYTIGNTTTTVPNVGGRLSVISSQFGDTFNMAASNFDIAVVPEPGSLALIVVGAAGAGLAVHGRRRRRRTLSSLPWFGQHQTEQ